MKSLPAFDRNNAMSVFLMAALPAIMGSTISVMLSAFVVWAVICLVLGRFAFRLTRTDRVIAGTITAFVALELATAFLGENRSQVLVSTYWLLPFLGVWVVVPRLRASPQLDYLNLYIKGAAIGAIGALIIALMQVAISGSRAEGGAGNAAVFGIISLCLAGIAGLNVSSAVRRDRFLAAVGTMAGLLAVVLSLTRGVVLASAVTVILLIAYMPGVWRSPKAKLAGAAAAVFAAIAIYAASDLITDRFYDTVEEIDMVIAGETSENIGERLRLWMAGWQIIGESPIFGHGIQNRMDKVEELLRHDGPLRNFTHAHNAFISFTIDGGIVVLAALLAVLFAPIYVAWQAPRDPDHRKRLFFALQVSLIYAACGLSQIMFKHDIMDSFFIFSMIVLAASIPDPNRQAVEGTDR
ncbi:O-antigen ligase family protein [Mesorhizobium sp. CAU 1732]|uniref:O-antigen ligase family protein n=1 Tax=Mesorhizobium sp. CAU 1732 TaxID=3140358 RepID=UPI003260943A